MNIVHIPGQDRGEVFLYALSTCVWCKKTKAFLDDSRVDYRYVDVDLVEGDERETVVAELARWNPSRNFPTIVVNNADVIVGFHPERLKELLKL
jgi:glutaredoxin-like protein NrdH